MASYIAYANSAESSLAQPLCKFDRQILTKLYNFKMKEPTSMQAHNYKIHMIWLVSKP
jgi:hypothetical protein